MKNLFTVLYVCAFIALGLAVGDFVLTSLQNSRAAMARSAEAAE